MTKQDLISIVKTYFLKIRNQKSWVNNNSYFQVFFAFNRFLIIAGNLRFEIIVKKLSDDDLIYEIKCQDFFLKFPNKYNSNSENSAIEGFTFLIDAYNSLLDKGSFRTFLFENLNNYQYSIVSTTENDYKKFNNHNSSFSITRIKPIKWHVYTEIVSKSIDTSRVGKDTKTNSSIEISFKVLPINETGNLDNYELIQSHLNQFSIYEYETSYGYYAADTQEHISEHKVFDLNLTRYVNQISIYSNGEIHTKPLIKDYKNDTLRANIFRKAERDLLSLKVIIYFIFSDDKVLQNVDFKFYDLMSIIRIFKPNIVPDKDQHLFYEQVISELSFYEIYDSNKEIIEAFLSPHRNLNDKLIQYYSCCYNNVQLFDVDSIHYAFKTFFDENGSG